MSERSTHDPAVRGLARVLAMLLTVSHPATGAEGTIAPPEAPRARLEIVTPTQSCSDLSGFDLGTVEGAGGRITGTEETRERGATVCSVRGVLEPSIGFEVRLPTSSWTQRYLQIGCGGLCGNIRLTADATDGCVPLRAGGFVVAATDMGHRGRDASFGDDPQKRADFAHRAQHLTAITAKRLIEAFYGRPPRYAYFTGCSDGGREALIEAQRYPGDFDGIVAGAPAMNFQVQNALFHAWQARANTGADGKAILLAGRLPILHRAVLEACDRLDGLEDGLVSDPLACRFDPGGVRCPADARDTGSCLTAVEVDVVRRLYDGPRDPVTNERLTLAGPLPGSELAWAGVYVPADADQPPFSRFIASEALGGVVFERNPPAGFDLGGLAFDRATFDRLRPLHPLYDATNPDLSAFASAGGKLILWHGLADPHISPANTIAYHVAVEGLMGRERAQAFERLYLFPGMDHCSGGDGPSSVDMLSPMLAWVETGTPPDAVVARQPERGAIADPGAPGMRGPGPDGARGGPHGPPPEDGPPARRERPGASRAIARSRPVYPYPAIAAHDGRGDPNDAGSYGRGASRMAFTMPAWMGADFYRPYAPLRR